jgi:hypothetical protein
MVSNSEFGMWNAELKEKSRDTHERQMTENPSSSCRAGLPSSLIASPRQVAAASRRQMNRLRFTLRIADAISNQGLVADRKRMKN